MFSFETLQFCNNFLKMWLIVIICFTLIVLVYDWMSDRPMKRFKNVLPGPEPLPILGNSLMALGDSAKFLRVTTELIATYGERLRAYMLSTLYILLINPKDVEVVITSNEVLSKSKDYDFIQPWLGQGLLTATGMRWKKHRKFLTPAFHFNILQNFLPIFEKNEKILTKKLKSAADGTPVDVFPIIALAALDNISESAMGVELEAQCNSESEYVKAVQEISSIIFTRIRHPIWRFNSLFKWLPAKTRQDKALKVLQEFTYGVIKNRRKALQQAGTTLDCFKNDIGVKKKIAFLDLLLLSELDGKKLSDEIIREEVETFMFEGHDTTTSAISFTLYSISQHEDIQKKLYEEQYQIFEDDTDRPLNNSSLDREVLNWTENTAEAFMLPSYNQVQWYQSRRIACLPPSKGCKERDPQFYTGSKRDLSRMSYLEMVIKESLRLYPSVPYIARQVTEDTHIVGLDLPKGTNIVLSIFHMQRLPSVFEDPLSFKPERYLSENISKRNPYSWISFSAGPRNCIGQKFAMMEMKVVLSSIIRNFTLLPSGIEPICCADLILRSHNGVFVKFLPRN